MISFIRNIFIFIVTIMAIHWVPIGIGIVLTMLFGKFAEIAFLILAGFSVYAAITIYNLRT